MKPIVTALLAIIVLSSYAIQVQAQSPQASPQKTKTISISPEKKLEIVTLQRDYAAAYASEQGRRQQFQAQEQKAQQDAEKAIRDMSDKINASVTKLKTDMKLPATAQFDPMSVSFVVPEDAEKK